MRPSSAPLALRVFMTLLAISLLSGCANLGAVKDFAASTQDMTNTLRTEMQQVSKLCEGPADMRVLLDEAQGRQDAPGGMGKRLKAACAGLGKESTALQTLTVEALQAYGAALAAVADDKRFDVRASIEATGKKVASLPAPEGGSLVDKAKVGAVTRLLALVGDALARQQREDALRQLLGAEDSLLGVGQAMRGYFVPTATSGASAYQNVVATAQGLRADLLTDLDAFKEKEPIRVAELRRSLPPDKAFTERDARQCGALPGRMAVLIDRWLALVPVFRQEALRPPAKALLEALDDLRKDVRDTRDAAGKAGF